jgi:kynurenine formamidase
MALDGGDEDLAKQLSGWGGKMERELESAFTRGPMRFNDDYIIMALQASTQWDALAHVYYDGLLYNGFPAGAVTSRGASRNAIDQVATRGGVTGRGVLLDVARFRGLDSLPPSTAVLPEELDATARAQGVQIKRGDIVLIRTGWWPRFAEIRDGTRWLMGSPGLSWRCVQWLSDNEIAAVAADNQSVEVMPPEDGVFLLFHMLAIRDLGMMLGEIWDLESLAADCAHDGVYDFFLSAAPLEVTGAVGSPVNPIAIK